MTPFSQSMRSDLLSSSYADSLITFFAALSMASLFALVLALAYTSVVVTEEWPRMSELSDMLGYQTREKTRTQPQPIALDLVL